MFSNALIRSFPPFFYFYCNHNVLTCSNHELAWEQYLWLSACSFKQVEMI